MMPATRQEAKDRIEQGIANGWRHSRIMRVYGYDYELVKRVYDLMLWEPPARRPHGSHKAFLRHRAEESKPCQRCRVAERDYQATVYLQLQRGAA